MVEEQDKAAQVEETMRQQGVDPHIRVQDDYFGFDEHHRVMLPDGTSWVEFKVMTEGDRRKYLNGQDRGIRVSRASGDAHINAKPGDERYFLLKNTIVGWNLVRNGEPVPFSQPNLEKFLEGANPRVVNEIEKEVRKAHPWLLGEMTSEDIKKQIDDLKEMLKVAEEREAGNAT